MQYKALFALVLLCGCGGGNDVGDMTPADAAPPSYLLFGTYAMRMQMTVGAGTLDQIMIGNAFNTPNSDGTAAVAVTWRPCAVTVGSNLQVPFAHVLELEQFQTTTGSLSGKGEATYVQPSVTVPFGACLSNAATDALPTDGTVKCPLPADPTKNPCAQTAMRGCAITTVDASNVQWPGVPVPASGLTPDADVLYVDGRVSFALTGDVKQDANMSVTMSGSLSGGNVEWHILACHLRSGAACAATDVQTLNTNKPAFSFAGGTLEAHAQPQYFTCPQFLSAVDASLAGVEMFDGGPPDGLTGMSLTFSDVQSDMDALGCATCHDKFTSGMHLVYSPWTQDLLQYNYQQVLPWTPSSTMLDGAAGGKFVNTAPIPYPVRARWLQWIAEGAPF
jgi:hypothetical protein